MSRVIIIGFSSANTHGEGLFLKEQIGKYIESYLQIYDEVVFFYEYQDVAYDYTLCSKVKAIRISGLFENCINLLKNYTRGDKIIAAYPAIQRFPIFLIHADYTFYLGNDIFTLQNNNLYQRLKKEYLSLLVRCATGVIVRGEWLMNRVNAINSNVIKSPPISFVSNDIDVDLSISSYNLYIGNISEEKNTHKLIDYFEKKINQNLVLCGNFLLSDHYRHKVDGCDNIFYLGFIKPNQMVSLYKKAERVFMVSNSEGVPRVIEEARHFGVPVWSTRLPTVLTEFGDNVNYLNFPLNYEDFDAVFSSNSEVASCKLLPSIKEISKLHNEFT